MTSESVKRCSVNALAASSNCCFCCGFNFARRSCVDSVRISRGAEFASAIAFAVKITTSAVSEAASIEETPRNIASRAGTSALRVERSRKKLAPQL